MISFITIGKNEGATIEKSITSILTFCNWNNLKSFEIIYVDSDSSDDTLLKVTAFQNVKIIKITGEINAAVARNVGATHSRGGILFFIDGDMEIEPAFYSKVFDKNGELVHDFVSGDFIDHYYDRDGKMYREEVYYKLPKDRFESITGGNFIVKRSYWELLGGMKNKYRRCQDLDFGLRMSLLGVQLLRKKDIIAIHHTVSYYDEYRLWQDLFNGNQLYQKSVLYRDHLFNPSIYKFIIREISLFGLVCSIVLSLIFSNFYFILLFLLSIAVKSIYKSSDGVSRSFFKRFIYYGALDILVFFGIFVFWPSNKKNYKIIKVN